MKQKKALLPVLSKPQSRAKSKGKDDVEELKRIFTSADQDKQIEAYCKI